MTPLIRIVALGDSTTAGTPGFTSPREAPPAGRGNRESQYGFWLMRSHSDWEVVNQGINRERSDQIRARFDPDVLALSPAAVVIIAGVNDVYEGLGPESVERELAAMYQRALEANIAIVAGAILPYNTATADQNARMRAINDWIRAQARAHRRIGFVDTRAAVAARANPDVLASSPDGLHPDVAGYRRMAEAIGPALERALHPR